MSKKKIIIISIIVVAILIIAIPLILSMFVTSTVKNTIDTAKQKQFEIMSNSVESWLNQEYSLLEINRADDEFIELCGIAGTLCENEVNITEEILDEVDIEEDNIDLRKSTIKINGKNKICVKLVASNRGIFKGAVDVYSNGCK